MMHQNVLQGVLNNGISYFSACIIKTFFLKYIAFGQPWPPGAKLFTK